MNTKRRIQWGLLTAAVVAAGAFGASGCELLVDFDRSKIPEGDASLGDDGSTADSPSGDSTMMGDSPTTDGPGSDVVTTEGGNDSGPDGSKNDGGMEASTGDASDGGGTDAPVDAPKDAPAETTTEAGTEGGVDAAPEAEAGAPVYTLSPATFDYGTVALTATTAGFSFTVKNTGTASGTPSVSLSGANSGDFAISNNGCTAALAVNATCTVNVTFAPGGTGSRAGTLNAGSATSSLGGTGAQNGTLTISPASGTGGSVTVGQTGADVSYTLTNSDAVNAVNLSSLTLTGTGAGQFAFDADGGTGQCTSGGSLAASGTCTVLVHFTPSAAGLAYASITAVGAATDGGAAAGTATASITGLGQ